VEGRHASTVSLRAGRPVAGGRGELNSHSGSVNLESSPVKKLRYEGQGSMTHVTMGCVDAERFVCMPDPGRFTVCRRRCVGTCRVRRAGGWALQRPCSLPSRRGGGSGCYPCRRCRPAAGLRAVQFSLGTFWWRRVRIPCGRDSHQRLRQATIRPCVPATRRSWPSCRRRLRRYLPHSVRPELFQWLQIDMNRWPSTGYRI